jgi:hypothetical protein
MAIAAAVTGLGVVLESTLRAEGEMQTGSLVAPLRAVTHPIHKPLSRLSKTTIPPQSCEGVQKMVSQRIRRQTDG